MTLARPQTGFDLGRFQPAAVLGRVRANVLPMPYSGLDVDRSTQRPYAIVDNREAEAQATDFVSLWVRSSKPTKDRCKGFLRNAETVVAYLDQAAVTILLLASDFHVAYRFRGVGVIDRIREQIDKYQLQRAHIDGESRQVVGYTDLDAASFSHLAQLTCRLLHNRRHVNRLNDRVIVAALDPSDGFELVSQVDEMRDVPLQHLDRTPC